MNGLEERLLALFINISLTIVVTVAYIVALLITIKKRKQRNE